MKIEISGTFTIKVAQEDGLYIGTVLENNVSSFGSTKEEALEQTAEALDLWMESQLDYRAQKMTAIIKQAQQKSNKPQNTYTINYSDATDIHRKRNHEAPRKSMICA